MLVKCARKWEVSLEENLCVREVRVKQGSKPDDMHENYAGKREVSSTRPLHV